jgi:hypothetical protein
LYSLLFSRSLIKLRARLSKWSILKALLPISSSTLSLKSSLVTDTALVFEAELLLDTDVGSSVNVEAGEGVRL